MNRIKLYFIFNNDRLLVKINHDNIYLPTDNDIKSLSVDSKNLFFLTTKDDTDYFFGRIDLDLGITNEFKFYKLRVLISLMDNPTFNLAARAFHLLQWNDTYKYCSKCGTLIDAKKDDLTKTCHKCGFTSYPKISPAIITAVTKDDQLLLAHNTTFPKEFYSVLAGFVEPGETFEDCVAREVYEEVGIQVKNIKYFGSQPWPFPDSLMVAFTCEYAGGNLKVDGVEIDDAAFYKIEDFPKLPLPGSIARRLVNWFINK